MAHYQKFLTLRQDSLTTGNSSEATPVKVFFTGTSNEAPIFSDFVGGASITQPLLSNTLAQGSPGRFSFFIADGIYDVVINPGGAIETRFDEEVIKEKDTFTMTKAEMEADKSLKLGDVVIITDRADARGTVVTGETPNTFDIIDLTPTGLQWQLTVNAIVDARAFGAPGGVSQDSRVALEAAYNFCRDNGKELLVSGTFRIDAPMTWTASGGLNAQTVVRFDNARFTKNFNGAGLTCAGGASLHMHYGDLIIDKMTNLGDGTGGNATAGDFGFVQNSRLERHGSLLIESQAGDAYVCQADTNMNGSDLGFVRIRSCDGKGFTGTGTQNDNAIWIGNIWANDCFEGGIFIPDTFNARAWKMTMRAENCAQDMTSDQIYTGGMLGCLITGYAEDNSAGSGVEVHIPAASTNVDFFTWRVDSMTLSSPTSRITQGNTIYAVGSTPTESNVRAENLSNDVTKTVTKNWIGSSSADLVKRIIRGKGELTYQVTGRTTGDVMTLDMLPDTFHLFRLQKNGVDEWSVSDGGVGHYLSSLVAGATSAPDASAVIEARSTTKGLLLPRMTTTQRDAISSPSDGLMVYNITTDKINVRASGAWEAVTSS